MKKTLASFLLLISTFSSLKTAQKLEGEQVDFTLRQLKNYKSSTSSELYLPETVYHKIEETKKRFYTALHDGKRLRAGSVSIQISDIENYYVKNGEIQLDFFSNRIAISKSHNVNVGDNIFLKDNYVISSDPITLIIPFDSSSERTVLAYDFRVFLLLDKEAKQVQNRGYLMHVTKHEQAAIQLPFRVKDSDINESSRKLSITSPWIISIVATGGLFKDVASIWSYLNVWLSTQGHL